MMKATTMSGARRNFISTTLSYNRSLNCYCCVCIYTKWKRAWHIQNDTPTSATRDSPVDTVWQVYAVVEECVL